MSVRSIDRKLSRERDQRRLLIRTLATQLVMHKSITTSRPRAKVLVPYIERIVARGQKGGLHARRYVRARLDTVEATHEVLDIIAPQSKRGSGFVRSKRAGFKVGDNTPLVTVSFVDTFNPDAEVKTAATKPAKKATPAKKKATTKKTAAAKTPTKAKKA